MVGLWDATDQAKTRTAARIEYPASESDEPLSRSGVVRNRAIYLYGIEFSADQQQSNCLYDQ